MKFFIILFYTIIFPLSLFAQTTSKFSPPPTGKNLPSPICRRNCATLIKAGTPKTARIEKRNPDADDCRCAAGNRSRDAKNHRRETHRRNQAAKAAAPTEAQIKAVYEANKSSVGERTLPEMREQIVDFLRRESEQKALIAFVKRLQTKYKAAPGKASDRAESQTG